MTQSSPMDTLEINVENFGPITEAKIDLRPLTLFIGPSNSGKSYFSTLIYALHHALGAAYRTAYRSKNFEWGCSEHDIRKLTNWLESSFPQFSDEISTEDDSIPTQKSFELPEDISRLVRPALVNNSNFNPAVKDEIERCFGADSIESLIRQGGSGHDGVSRSATVTFKKIKQTHQNSIESFTCNFEFDANSSNFSLDVSPEIPLRIWNPFYDPTSMGFCIKSSGGLFGGQIDGDSTRQAIGARLASSVLSNLIDPIGRVVHYLPGDRSGVMRVHRLILKAAVKRMSKAGIDARTLSGVLTDFLEQLIDVNDGPVAANWNESYSRFIKKYACYGAPAEQFALLQSVTRDIESEVLGGNVYSETFDNSTTSDLNVFYTPNGWSNPLPLMRASSMVSELSPIVLYLRHVVAPGNVLIIEEPEAHLHPDLQIEFINVLTEIAKAGVRIIMTTHSVSILDAVANLVFSSEADRQSGEDAGGLTRQDVGLWSFVPTAHPKGSIVREINFDQEVGGFSTEFDDAAAKLHNSWAEIDSRIHRGIP